MPFATHDWYKARTPIARLEKARTDHGTTGTPHGDKQWGRFLVPSLLRMTECVGRVLYPATWVRLLERCAVWARVVYGGSLLIY